MKKVKLLLSVTTIFIILSILAVKKIFTYSLPLNKEKRVYLESEVKGKGHDYVCLYLGEPYKYSFRGEEFKIDNLPETYVMLYKKGVSVFIYKDKIIETRISGKKGFKDFNGVKLGDNINSLIECTKKPLSVIENKEVTFIDNTLYINCKLNGKKISYYSVPEKGIRVFLEKGKITTLINTDNLSPSFLKSIDKYLHFWHNLKTWFNYIKRK